MPRPEGTSHYGPPRGYKPSPQEVHAISALRKEVSDCRDAADFLTSGCGWYEECGVDVIVPDIMCRDGNRPSGIMWYDHYCHFPFSDEQTRNLAWNEMLDYEDAPEALPRRLVDAWDTGKRSREYLNGEMDSFDLNSIYYSEAYRK